MTWIWQLLALGVFLAVVFTLTTSILNQATPDENQE